MWRIIESELILPSLFIINKKEDKKINTSELIIELRQLLNPWKEDTEILEWRKDDKFSQKVRNLRAHRTLEKQGYTVYKEKYFHITQKWEEYLFDNKLRLEEIIKDEQLLDQLLSPISSYYQEFQQSIAKIKQLLEIKTWDLEQYFINLLYASVITSLETYLSDCFKLNIFTDDIYMQRFVETFEPYQKEEIYYKDIYKQYENIDKKIKSSLENLMYHNLQKIRKIYKNTFNISIWNITNLEEIVLIRHDLVHRNWKNKSWKVHKITKRKVLKLCEDISIFVWNIEKQLNKLWK